MRFMQLSLKLSILLKARFNTVLGPIHPSLTALSVSVLCYPSLSRPSSDLALHSICRCRSRLPGTEIGLPAKHFMSHHPLERRLS
jgi:hypothetical protein